MIISTTPLYTCTPENNVLLSVYMETLDIETDNEGEYCMVAQCWWYILPVVAFLWQAPHPLHQSDTSLSVATLQSQ